MPGLGDASDAVAGLLRTLLGVAIGLMLCAALLALVRDLVAGTGTPLALLVLVVVQAAIGVALLRAETWPLRRLRILEALAFGSTTAYLAGSGYRALALAASQADTTLALARWNTLLVSCVFLILAYGTLVPNPWRRAAVSIGAMAATPVGVALALRAREVPTGPIRELATSQLAMESLSVLVMAVILAILATYIIGRYFDTAYKTRLETMYSLERRIGSGGMGEVWLAEHHTLARPAAVKLIRAATLGRGTVSDLMLRRFEREAKLTASLRSAHTIEVYDFGVTNDGTFYYAMEHLEGLDLATLVERFGPLPAGRVIYLLRQACASLGEAHHKGMIHRDIKPANLFTCRMGLAHDFVKVLDFGLVKTEAHEDGATDLTIEGTASGTPGYMAPEMALDPGAVDNRADIYALGCVAYLLLTGEPVFEASTPLATLLEHVKSTPVPPSERTELPIPEALEAVILRCLDKDPARRYQSATELRAALAACPLEEPWDEARAAQWWMLHLPEMAA